jgi:hypothetical protein
MTEIKEQMEVIGADGVHVGTGAVFYLCGPAIRSPCASEIRRALWLRVFLF